MRDVEDSGYRSPAGFVGLFGPYIVLNLLTNLQNLPAGSRLYLLSSYKFCENTCMVELLLMLPQGEN